MPNAENISGKIFGRLTCVSIKGRTRWGIIWKCRCICGGQVDVIKYDLTSGHTKSCGCLKKERQRKACTKDLTGRRFGWLTVSSQAVVNDPAQRAHWNCVCECGGTKVVVGYSLIRGATGSCGCKLSARAAVHKMDISADDVSPELAGLIKDHHSLARELRTG